MKELKPEKATIKNLNKYENNKGYRPPFQQNCSQAVTACLNLLSRNAESAFRDRERRRPSSSCSKEVLLLALGSGYDLINFSILTFL